VVPTAPATCPPGTIRIVPLGGLGEVGMNCLAIEDEQGVLVVDCGIRFPYDDLGVDVIRPDFTWLVERRERIRGVFITHGHEDHIGALPYLLADVECPVWGPPHALGLVRRRLAEHGFDDGEADLRVSEPRRTYAIGGCTVEPIRVTHSIVEATALAIHTPAGAVVHTGDFKFDDDPPDGEPTDESRLAEIAEDGVSLLLSDSTNVDVEKPSGSERSVGSALEDLVRDAPHRVFIALFSSNIQRLMLIGEIAARADRKICVLGRSLKTQIEVATQIGRLKWSPGLRVGPDDAKTMPRGSVLVLAGGTQGESASAMARLATGTRTHPDLAIEPDDAVIFSSRTIPGNERPVFEMVANAMRRGARVHTRVTDPGVHTSGHATRAEQAKMLDLIRPRCFLPVHGTLHHLERHAELARAHGVPEVRVVENGTSVLFDGRSLAVEGSVPSGRVAVGFGGIEVGVNVLHQRAELARSGLASVALVLDEGRGLLRPPSVLTQGVAGVDETLLRSVGLEIARVVDSARKKQLSSDNLKDDVRRAVRRRLMEAGGVKPVVEVHLVEPRD
jgi:ribonuclease J